MKTKLLTVLEKLRQNTNRFYFSTMKTKLLTVLEKLYAN